MRYQEDYIEELKRSNPPEEILPELGIELTRQGRYLKGICPFHDDHTPSLIVSPQMDLWNCLGCTPDKEGRTGGDIITFLKKYLKMNFTDAVKWLEGRNNGGAQKGRLQTIDSRPQTKDEEKPSPLIARTRILEDAVAFYHKTLLGDDRRGVKYLARRGINDKEIIDQFRIGFVNGSMKKIIPHDGEMIDSLKSAGILNEKGNEFFYNCVVFPITDENNSVVGLYGRNIEKNGHLYLPGPHRGVFNWQAAKAHREIILTEGIIDTLSLYILGHRNVISLYGTNGLTSDHLSLFEKEKVKRIYLCLDNDEAGKKAQESLIKKLSPLGIETFIVQLPSDCQDANDYLKKRASGLPFKTLLEKAEYKTINQGEGKAGALIDHSDDTAWFSYGDIQYKVRGISLNGLDAMRLVVTALSKNFMHTDRFDLYSSRARRLFSSLCSRRLDLQPARIEEDLLNIITSVEKLKAEELEKQNKEGKKEPPPMTDEEEKSAKKLLLNPHLLDRAVKDLEITGFAGEDINKRVAYLVASSRKLDKPLSLVVKSQSGAGKSYLMEVTAELMPPEDVQFYSRLTPQSLYYMGKDDLAHKLLIVDERSGSLEADYSIRNLQTRNKLTLAAPIKDPSTGKTKTHIFEINGPIVYMESSTNPILNPENANRCFEAYLDESREQTLRIHKAQRDARSLQGWQRQDKREKVVTTHRNAQRLLRPIKVINPFQDLISFPHSWIRTRRDHDRFLSLIEVVTFLYQYQREIKQDKTRKSAASENRPYIESTLDDYRIAYELARVVLTHSLQDISKGAKDLLQTIEEKVKEEARKAHINERDYSFTRRDIRSWSHLPDHIIKQYMRQIEDLEYVEIKISGKGGRRQYRLIFSPERNSILKGLTTPQELESKLKSN